MGDQVVAVAAQEAAGFDRILDTRELGARRARGIAHDLDLLLGERAHQAQLAEHLEVFLVIFRRFLHALFAVVRHVEVETEAQPLAQLDVLVKARVRLLPGEHDLVHGAALGRAAAHHALDAVLGHELERARRAALDRLPALDRQVERPRDEGQLLERIAAVGHLGRQGVVLALVREALLVERLEDDVDLLLEQLAVCVLVDERRAEGLDFAGVIAAAHAEYDAPAGQNVGDGVILGHAQRMPHGRDVEAAADLDVFRAVREVHAHQDVVGDALGALALEMVLGHPEAVVAEPVHQHRHGLGLGQRGREMRVRITPRVDGRAAVADVVEIGVAGVEAVELGDHGGGPAVGAANLRRGEGAVDWVYPSPRERQANVVVIASAAKQSRAMRTIPGLLRRRWRGPSQ